MWHVPEVAAPRSPEYSAHLAALVTDGALLAHLAMRGQDAEAADRRAQLLGPHAPGYELDAIAAALPFLVIDDLDALEVSGRSALIGLRWMRSEQSGDLETLDELKALGELDEHARAAVRAVVDPDHLGAVVDALWDVETIGRGGSL